MLHLQLTERSASVGMPLRQPEHAHLMPIMCYSKKDTQFPGRSPDPRWAACLLAITFPNPSVRGTELPCKPQCKPSVSHLSPTPRRVQHCLQGLQDLEVCSELVVGPVNACPTNPSSRSHPLEGELVVFVAEPEMCYFRKMFEVVLPRAMQVVKPWGAATPAARHPGAFEQGTDTWHLAKQCTEGRVTPMLCCFLGWICLASQQLNLFPSTYVIL